MVSSAYMHAFTFVNAPGVPFFPAVFLPIIVIAAAWELVLKGFGLWYAARGKQKWWFIAMLILNTVGILPIIYLIWFRPKNTSAPTGGSSAAG